MMTNAEPHSPNERAVRATVSSEKKVQSIKAHLRKKEIDKQAQVSTANGRGFNKSQLTAISFGLQ